MDKVKKEEMKVNRERIIPNEGYKTKLYASLLL